jgi:radical SAM protein with 4Fe4S-binding SPASM domain
MSAGDGIRTIPYSQLQARMGLRENRVPVDGTLETTYRCNLRCVHCYVNEAVGDKAIAERETPLPELKRILDQMAEAGTMHLLLTGGEVLVRPDFPELYRYAVGKGLLVTVFTNGTMITDAIADLFDEHRPEAVEITLYGMSRETYDRVTAIPGSYDKCLQGIARLVKRGITLRLKTMALTWNQHEVKDMVAYAESLGVPFKFDGLLNPRVDCGANRNGELQLSPEQVLALDLADPERVAEFRRFCDDYVPAPEAAVPREQVYSCGAGETTFTVDPYNRLQMCQLSRRSHFDLHRGSFAEGWNEFFPMLRARKWQKNHVCAGCNIIALCGSCPGAAEMEHGDIEAMVAGFCEIAHLRADAFMGRRSGHRKDATCCLGRGTLAAQPEEAQVRATQAGCGSGCGSHETAPLVQLQVRRSR